MSSQSSFEDPPAGTLTLASGMQIGRYLIGKKLGRGGFGVVFRAHDTSLDREVALKFLHPEHTATPQMLNRFLQEARSAAKIPHAGIVTVYECGQVTGTGTPADGSAYIAMELLQGESLTDRLSRAGRLDPAAAMEIVRQVASALEAAHRAGIVHRDLKPDNIFLVPDSAVQSGERVKVLDFGIAKGRSSGVETQSMTVFGTPRYMSPEQCRSAAHVDHRSDIYSLGCILFELVCGRPPFAGDVGELIAQHVLIEPPAVESIEPSCSTELAAAIAQMLEKDPNERPQTMAAVQRVLERSGAWSPGVAPTLLPDAIPSAPIIAKLPSGMQSRRHRAAHPTTLHAATGVSVVQPAPPPKRPIARIAGAVGALGAVTALVLVLALRGGGTSNAPVPPSAVEQPTPTEKAPVEKAPVAPAAMMHVESLTVEPEIEMPPAPVGKPANQPPKPAPPKSAPKTAPKTAPSKTAPPSTAPKIEPKPEPKVEPKEEPKPEPPPEPTPEPKKGRDKTINPFAKTK